MARISVPARIYFAVVLCFAALLHSGISSAANIRIVGNAGYSQLGTTVVLTADRIQNNDAVGISGTLRVELWAFPSAYTGAAQAGYKLAQYGFGTLKAGFGIPNFNSGVITFLRPPDGTWIYTFFVTEFTGGIVNDGYEVRDWVNFSLPVTWGSPLPPQPITPAVGLWWNPNESGSGYNFDVKHGVLVVTVYSYKSNGEPQWYITSGPIVNNSFTGTLNKAFGGQCISCPYTGAPVSPGNDGIVTINFFTPTSAIMYLPGGRVTSIQPQAF